MVCPCALWAGQAEDRGHGHTSRRRSSSLFSSMLGTKSEPFTMLRTCGAHACASSSVMQDGHATEIASALAAGTSAFSLSLHGSAGVSVV